MRARIYFALMLLIGLSSSFIENAVMTNTLPAYPYAFVFLGCLVITLLFVVLLTRDVLRHDPYHAVVAEVKWPDDPDPTDNLTQPMADPYLTQPYDPQADIPTQPIDDYDYWTPHRYRGSIKLPPDV